LVIGETYSNSAASMTSGLQYLSTFKFKCSD